MTLRDTVQWLLDNKYAVLVDNELILTAKLHKDLKALSPLPVPAKTAKKATIDTQYREIWKRFVEAAGIPSYNMAQDGRTYYLRPYSPGGVVELIKILRRGDIDEERFVAATKHYYETAAFKKTLANYLRDGLWEEAYKTYIDSPKTQSGENPFER